MPDTPKPTAPEPMTSEIYAACYPTEREVRRWQRQHPELSSFLSGYRFWRSFPSNLTREEALEELESQLPVEVQQILADVVDRGL